MRFENCRIDNVNFDNCLLINVVLDDCDLIETTFSNIVLINVTLTRCFFYDYMWQNGSWLDCEKTGDRTASDPYLYFEAQRVIAEEVPIQIADPDWLDREYGYKAWQAALETSRTREYTQEVHTKEESPVVEVPYEVTDWRMKEEPIAVGQSGCSSTDGHRRYFPSSWSASNVDAQSQAGGHGDATPNAPRRAIKQRTIFVAPMPHDARHLARGGIFPFVHLPLNVREKIYGQVLAPTKLLMTDVPLGAHLYDGPQPPPHQLHYKL